AFRPARMLARRDLILAHYYGGKTPVPPALEDSIPEMPQIEPPILPPLLDTLVLPDTTRDHPDSGGPVDSVRRVFPRPRLVYQPQRHHERHVGGGIVPAYRFDRCRTLGCFEREAYLVGR